MDFFINHTLFSATIMILVGFLALRFVGRKSLSKMTLSQAVIMIAIGSILVEPVKKKELDVTILTIFLFVIVLIILEFIALKFPIIERFLVGRPLTVIANGKIEYQNLKKLRLSEEQLYMLLRQNGIDEVTDVKVGTLEANGNFSYEVIGDAKSLTIKEFKKLTGNFFDDYKKMNVQINEGKFFEGFEEDDFNSN